MSQNENPSAPTVPSPCIGVCTLRGDTCYGCGRTTDEIAVWSDLGASGQAAVWALLPARLVAFGFRSFRLAATAPVVSGFIGRTFAETAGRWRVVTPTVEGSLAVAGAEVSEDGVTVLAAAAAKGARLGLVRHDKLRVFGFQRDETRAGMDTVALVLPKGLAHREAETCKVPAGAVALAAPDRFSRAWLIGAGSAAADFDGLDWAETARRLPEALAVPGTRLRLEHALGWIETDQPLFAAVPPAEDANAPGDVKVSKAFIAGAIFEADDPDWLAQALAPI